MGRSSGNEFVPCFHSGSWEEIGGRGRGGTIVDARLAGHDFVAQGGYLATNNGNRSGGSVGDKSRFVVAKEEFPNECEGLCQEY